MQAAPEARLNAPSAGIQVHATPLVQQFHPMTNQVVTQLPPEQISAIQPQQQYLVQSQPAAGIQIVAAAPQTLKLASTQLNFTSKNLKITCNKLSLLALLFNRRNSTCTCSATFDLDLCDEPNAEAAVPERDARCRHGQQRQSSFQHRAATSRVHSRPTATW